LCFVEISIYSADIMFGLMLILVWFPSHYFF